MKFRKFIQSIKLAYFKCVPSFQRQTSLQILFDMTNDRQSLPHHYSSLNSNTHRNWRKQQQQNLCVGIMLILENVYNFLPIVLCIEYVQLKYKTQNTYIFYIKRPWNDLRCKNHILHTISSHQTFNATKSRVFQNKHCNSQQC